VVEVAGLTAALALAGVLIYVGFTFTGTAAPASVATPAIVAPPPPLVAPEPFMPNR
jgi:hypothetical protein